jgi:hypothetical protein
VFANIEVANGKALTIEKDKGQLHATNVTSKVIMLIH